jgi:hypothetical protein
MFFFFTTEELQTAVRGERSSWVAQEPPLGELRQS